jgi:CHAD domain-containing protein
MDTEHFDFYLGADLSWPKFLQRLEAWGSLRPHPPSTASRTFFDSFDWRLYRSGTVLEEIRSNGDAWLICRALGSGEMLSRIEGTVPRFVRDLPPGMLRSRLESVIAMRAFLPVATLDSRLQVVDGLNKDDETVVRISLEENAVHPVDGSKGVTLPNRVVVIPVKGYDKVRRRLVKFLQRDISLTPAVGDQMEEAARVVGRRPGDYTSKLDFRLDPQMPTIQALTQILLHLLDVIEANEEGVKRDLDSEFLHDFRVAVRRTRSAMTQVKGVLAPELLARFKPEFAWLGAITGPTRDLDVYLLQYDAFRNGLPEAFRDHLEPLHHYLVVHQKMEQEKLAKDLEGVRYRHLVQEWRAALQGPVAGPQSINAVRPVAEVAGDRIWKVYRRTLKEGRAIHDGSPAEALHELRKTCKKLRYLLQFFQSLYSLKEVRKLIKALKALQDNLGEFQDLRVQSEFLREISDQMGHKEESRVTTLLAMGVLVEKLQEGQRRARTEFAGRFRLFSEPAIEASFKKLFMPCRREGEGRRCQ